MKKRNTSILFGIAMLMLSGSLFSWYSAHKVDARELALFQVLVQAVDEDTKENMNVSVQSPTTKLSEITGQGGQGMIPYAMELSTSGLVRATWIDLKDSDASIVLKAEGYEPRRVPADLIQRTENYSTLGGSRNPDYIQLKKTQQID